MTMLLLKRSKESAFRDFMADYEVITKAADAHPEVRELAAKELKSARDAVVRALSEALSDGKNRSNNSQGGMASSNVAGTEKSSQAKRKMPPLERNACKKKK